MFIFILNHSDIFPLRGRRRGRRKGTETAESSKEPRKYIYREGTGTAESSKEPG